VPALADLTAPILITGASGFIGRRLTARLIRTGQRPVVLARRGLVTTALPGAADVLLIPEFAPQAITEALDGRSIGAVVHLAAYGVAPSDRDPEAMLRVNLASTLALVNAAARAGATAMVIAGSSAEYRSPASPLPLDEDAPLETERLYGASKAAAGIAALALARSLRLPLSVARLFNVYGPGEASYRLLPTLLRGFAEQKRIALSPGDQLRDFIHVDDAISALLALLDVLQQHGLDVAGAVNVGTGEGSSVRRLAETAASIAGVDSALLGFGDVAMRPDDVPFMVANTQRIRQCVRWRHRYPLSEGLAASITEIGDPLSGTR
jgi:nucleoside-diphosphate-sugar epimerase